MSPPRLYLSCVRLNDTKTVGSLVAVSIFGDRVIEGHLRGLDCLFSICSPRFPLGRWRPRPRTSFNSQIPGATQSCLPAQPRPCTPARDQSYSAIERREPLLSQALPGVNISRRLLGSAPSPLSPVLAGLSWRGRPQQQR